MEYLIDCLLCGDPFPSKHTSFSIDEDTTLSFIRSISRNPPAESLISITECPNYIRSPQHEVLFCFYCHEKIIALHGTYLRLNQLLTQLSSFQEELREKLIAANTLFPHFILRERLINDYTLKAEAIENDTADILLEKPEDCFNSDTDLDFLNDVCYSEQDSPATAEFELPHPHPFHPVETVGSRSNSTALFKATNDQDTIYTSNGKAKVVQLKPVSVKLGRRIDEVQFQPSPLPQQILNSVISTSGTLFRGKRKSATESMQQLLIVSSKTTTTAEIDGEATDIFNDAENEEEKIIPISPKIAKLDPLIATRFPTPCLHPSCASFWNKIYKTQSHLSKHMELMHGTETDTKSDDDAADNDYIQEEIQSRLKRRKSRVKGCISKLSKERFSTKPLKCLEEGWNDAVTEFNSLSELHGQRRSIHGRKHKRKRPVTSQVKSELQMLLDEMKTKEYPRACGVEGCASTRIFDSYTLLARHLNNVHRKTPLSKDIMQKYYDSIRCIKYPTKCPYEGCTSTRVFPAYLFLYRHYRTVHLKNKKPDDPITNQLKDVTYPTSCTVENCKSDRIFEDSVTLRRHLKNVHSKAPVQKIIVNPQMLDSLAKLSYPTKCPLSGTDCQQNSNVYYSEEQLRAHYEILHGIRRNADLHRQELKQLNYPTVCPRLEGCPRLKEYKNSYNLKLHLIRAHDKKKFVIDESTQNFRCDDCNITFKFQVSLTQHLRGFHQLPDTTEKNFACDQCPKRCKTQCGLLNHKQQNHSEKSFLCNKCPKTFAVQRNLDLHMKRHMGEYKYFCRVCPRGFLNFFERVEHEQAFHWIELGLEQIKCHVCEKVYSKRGLLRTHLKTHSGANFNYNCSQCDYKTDNVRDFREHVDTVHTTEAKYQCSYCPLKFKLDRRRIQHEISHSANHPFTCEICGKKCLHTRSLRLHKEKQHNAPLENVPTGRLVEYDV